MRLYEFTNHVISIDGIDNDGYYGKQCMDLYNYYCRMVLGTQKGETGCARAKDIVTTEDNTRFFTVYKNTPDFIPEKGDVFVITGGKWGHVGIVTERGTLHEFKTLEQNRRGDRKLTREVRGYKVDGELYFLRPKNQENIKEVEQASIEGGDEMRIYRNGSTIEPVYGTSACKEKDKIGHLNKNEECVCVKVTNGVYLVEYKVDGTDEYKPGYVKYHG